MITLVNIRNFQSHKNTLLEFVPGINVIVGETDSGKSAIIRALSWCVTNRPQGFTFHSHFSDKPTSVLMEVDGHTVLRKKSGNTNIYKLDDQEFRALRAGVPPAIEELLALDGINWQHQHDSTFMLSDTASAIARRINAICDLEVIDQSVSKIKGMILQTSRNINDKEELLSEYRTDLMSMEELDVIQQQLEQVEKEHQRLTNLNREYKEIVYIVEQIDELEQQLHGHIPDINVSSLIDMHQDIERINKEIESLEGLMDEHTSMQKWLSAMTDVIKEMEAEIPDQCPICGNQLSGTGF